MKANCDSGVGDVCGDGMIEFGNKENMINTKKYHMTYRPMVITAYHHSDATALNRGIALILHPDLCDHLISQKWRLPQRSLLQQFRVNLDWCAMLYAREFVFNGHHQWFCHLRLDSSPQYAKNLLARRAGQDIIFWKSPVRCARCVSYPKQVSQSSRVFPYWSCVFFFLHKLARCAFI